MNKSRVFFLVLIGSVLGYMVSVRDVISLFSAPKPVAHVEQVEPPIVRLAPKPSVNQLEAEKNGATTNIDQSVAIDPAVKRVFDVLKAEDEAVRADRKKFDQTVPSDLDRSYAPTRDDVARVASDAVIARMLFGDRLPVQATVEFNSYPRGGELIGKSALGTADDPPDPTGLDYAERRRLAYHYVAYLVASDKSARAFGADDHDPMPALGLLCEFLQDDPALDFGDGDCSSHGDTQIDPSNAALLLEEMAMLDVYTDGIVALVKPHVARLIKSFPKRVRTTNTIEDFPGAWQFTTATLLPQKRVLALTRKDMRHLEGCASQYCGFQPARSERSASYCRLPKIPPVTGWLHDECPKRHSHGMCRAALDAASALVVSAMFTPKDEASLYGGVRIETGKDGHANADVYVYDAWQSMDKLLIDHVSARRNIAIRLADVAAMERMLAMMGPATAPSPDQIRENGHDACNLLVGETVPRSVPSGRYDEVIDTAISACYEVLSGTVVSSSFVAAKQRLESESALGLACAKAIVDENRVEIEALAERLLRHPPNDHRTHVMSTDEAADILCRFPTRLPEQSPAGTESFCQR